MPPPRTTTATTKVRPSSRNTVLSTHAITAGTFISFTVFIGIAYSLVFNTSLDTSNAILAHLPHPAAATSYFARKSNILNQLFVKRAWAWTTLAFFSLFLTSPNKIQSGRRVAAWAIATAVWLSFSPIFQRIITLSGGECIIHVPAAEGTNAPSTLTVPAHYCYNRAHISPLTHPELFANPIIAPLLASPHLVNFNGSPKFYHGHDVSGHIFLLTLSTLLLLDQVVPSLSYVFKYFAPDTTPTPRPIKASPAHSIAVKATIGLLSLWWWMLFMTSVYFHTTSEKLSGLCKSARSQDDSSALTLLHSGRFHRILYFTSTCLGLRTPYPMYLIYIT